MHTWNALLILGALGLWPENCYFTGHHPACRKHQTVAACTSDSHCYPSMKCEPDSTQAGGRCEGACKPYIGTSCHFDNPSRPDDCHGAYQNGRYLGCFATDKDPNRCKVGPGLDETGHPTCTDQNPPCSGCRQVLDTCDAHGDCYGIICF